MRSGWILGLSAWTVLGAALATAHPPAPPSDDAAGTGPFEAYLSEAHSWGELTFTVGPDRILVDWKGITLGPEASRALRELADGFFDEEDDGVVDRSERDDLVFAVSSMFRHAFAGLAEAPPEDVGLFIDDVPPGQLAVSYVTTDGLVGPVDRDDPIVVSAGLRIGFPDVDDGRSRHSVRLDMGPFYFERGFEDEARRVAGDLTLVVGAQKHWSFDADTIRPDCVAQAHRDGRIVLSGADVACFTGHDGVLLAFDVVGRPLPFHYLPGFDALVVAVGVVMGAALAARRRP